MLCSGVNCWEKHLFTDVAEFGPVALCLFWFEYVTCFRGSYPKLGSELTFHTSDAHILLHEPYFGN